jgi:hypothetical protein
MIRFTSIQFDGSFSLADNCESLSLGRPPGLLKISQLAAGWIAGGNRRPDPRPILSSCTMIGVPIPGNDATNLVYF